MDTKALAKSKRAHSQHHSKKHHPNVKSKAPSVGASSGKIPSGQQVTEKPHQPHGSSKLPSNWDRYEEEYDSGSENPSHNNMSQATDVVIPKSKGADYGHLISEAKSQSLTDISSEGFPSFDDVLTDFNQGVGSLLSVRGQGIVSRTGDDNFVVEDRATASLEASFLSLNLHLLAEQLAKVDLSQRLFIDPELLPPELCAEELKTSFSQKSEEVQAAYPSEGVAKNSVSTSTNQGLGTTNLIKEEVGHSRGTSEIIQQSDGTSIANAKKKSFNVQAAASEAELDMLLESFSETNFLDSSVVTENYSDSFSIHQETTSSSEGISSLKQVALQTSTKGPDSSKPASVANFGDALDDLLKETSCNETFSIRQQETSTSLLGGSPSVQSASAPLSRKGPNSSKSASITASFDDALDDLLNETPNLKNQNPLQSHEVISTHLDITSSSSSGPVSKSKVLDDFDTWFDNIDGP